MNPTDSAKKPESNGSSGEMPTIPIEPYLEMSHAATPTDAGIQIAPPFPMPTPEPAGQAPPPRGFFDRAASILWGFVLPVLLMGGLFLILVAVMPYLLAHWKITDAHAEAETVYTRRRAELKAEAEHADERLALLDKRVQLTSLGFREVARKVLPSVVNLANYREPTKEDLRLADAHKRRLTYDPDNDRTYALQGTGSGLIFKPGVILTNHHVVRGANRLRIFFASGRSIGVDVSACASDARTDLAIIRLPKELPAGLREEAQATALFADSDKDVQVGDWTLAMGSPLELRQTVSQGIVSAKGRLMSLSDVVLVELIQTTAALHPGSSGGPLFDQLGRVIGISVAIATDNGANQGIGFAIPSNTAKKIANLLLTKGEVPRGYLGILMEALPAPRLKAHKIDEGAILITEVVKEEAADRAGLKTGDIIVRVNKNAISRWKTLQHFRQLVVDFEPGAEVTLDIIRADRRRQIAVTLGKRPKEVR
ncbi:MAG: trypsin-like peptidase domain-containing protein [Planctomycetes bacterium]|jgi:S1-C subfamily serine protease|nr:trypsin-like peptidase domain-containing protein [Planctomycetota bacterium]